MKEIRRLTGNVCTELARNRDLSSKNITTTTTEKRKWKPNNYIVFIDNDSSRSRLSSRQTITVTNNISEWTRKDNSSQISAYEYTERYKKIRQHESEIRQDIMNIVKQKIRDVKDHSTKTRCSKRQRDENIDDGNDECKVKKVMANDENKVRVNGSALENITIKTQHHADEKSKKRKSDEVDSTVSEIKRPKIKFRLNEEKPRACVPEVPKEKMNEIQQCSSACVCKAGPSVKPKPISRSGERPEKPLYQKLLQRRLLNTVNMVFHDCCSLKCCEKWCKDRISADMLESDFDKSNLRVDYFSWGRYEQKIDDVASNDDWFW